MTDPHRYLRGPEFDAIDPKILDQVILRTVEFVADPTINEKLRFDLGVTLARHGLMLLIEQHEKIPQGWKDAFRTYAPTAH